MKVRVIYSVWGADGFDEPFGGGVHELEDVTEEQARSIASAAAAGAVEVIDASKAERSLLDGHVQSQEDGEAAYAAAQESGAWQHGNLTDFIATREQRLAELDEHDPERGDTEERRSVLAAHITEARARLAEMEAPS